MKTQKHRKKRISPHLNRATCQEPFEDGASVWCAISADGGVDYRPGASSIATALKKAQDPSLDLAVALFLRSDGALLEVSRPLERGFVVAFSDGRHPPMRSEAVGLGLRETSSHIEQVVLDGRVPTFGLTYEPLSVGTDEQALRTLEMDMVALAKRMRASNPEAATSHLLLAIRLAVRKRAVQLTRERIRNDPDWTDYGQLDRHRAILMSANEIEIVAGWSILCHLRSSTDEWTQLWEDLEA